MALPAPTPAAVALGAYRLIDYRDGLALRLLPHWWLGRKMAHHRVLLDHRLRRAGRPVDRCNRLARTGAPVHVLRLVCTVRSSPALSPEIITSGSIGAGGGRRCHMPPPCCSLR